MAPNKSKHGTMWTATDIEELYLLAAEGQPMDIVMGQLQRSRDAIRQKGLELGISISKQNKEKNKQR